MLKFVLAALLSLASLAAAAAPELAPSRFNSGAPVDGDAAGHRVPLILVHGLGGSGQGWEQFLKAYAANPSWRAAFKPYTFRYASSGVDVLLDPTAPRTISGLGAALRDALQASEASGRSVVILAHSMGGLVARSMMQEHSFADGRRGGERVLQLITLGTPHHGSPLADAAFALGLQYVEEFRDAYLGFVAGMAWTNYDGLNLSHGVCNPWLAALNNHAPSTYAAFGHCGVIPPIPRRGFYEKIVAYGARTLQQPDIAVGFGTFKPGSAPVLLAPYAYLHNSLRGGYDNDGIVPYDSALFALRSIASQKEAYACDHRFLERGYPVVVKSLSGTSDGWAFCAAANEGGTGLSASIVGASGGIAERIIALSHAERIFNWAEQAFSTHLKPAGAITDVIDGYHFRHYPGTQAYVGVKDGSVYYLGPGRGIERVGSVAGMLLQAQAAGF